MLAFQALAVLNFGTQAKTTLPILPSSSITWRGSRSRGSDLLHGDRARTRGRAVARLPLHPVRPRHQAAAENDRGAALTGISATRSRRRTTIIATVLAGVAGILIAPIASLDPTSYTLFVVPALGAALSAASSRSGSPRSPGCDRLRPVGDHQADTVWTWLPQQGLGDALPFVVIIVMMAAALAQRARPRRRGDRAQSVGGRPQAPLRTAAACFVAGADPAVRASGVLRFAFISSLTVTCIALSVVVLTGYVGPGVAGPDVAGRDRRLHARPHRHRPGHRLPVVADPGRACARCRSGWSSGCPRCGCAA